MTDNSKKSNDGPINVLAYVLENVLMYGLESILKSCASGAVVSAPYMFCIRNVKGGDC